MHRIEENMHSRKGKSKFHWREREIEREREGGVRARVCVCNYCHFILTSTKQRYCLEVGILMFIDLQSCHAIHILLQSADMICHLQYT
jgi:hypothetical protein